MRLRESGMPEAETWEGFFNAEKTLRLLGLNSCAGDVADLGAGYGTFALAAARIASGTVHAVELSPELAGGIAARARLEGLTNVRPVARDLEEEGSGVAESSVGFAMLFNMLHCECPEVLLAEAHRILRPGGLLAIMHWVSDRPTPRGPSLDIRPRPEQCVDWATGVGFVQHGETVDLPPYHFGLTLVRPSKSHSSHENSAIPFRR